MARRKAFRRAVYLALITISAIAIFSYVTNPFVRFSLVTNQARVTLDDANQIQLTQPQGVRVRDAAVWYNLAKVKSGWHFITNKLSGGDRARSYTVDEIIDQIHLARFSPELPFLISGEHFSVLYPRSLGIFYHSLLDPRTALNQDNWLDRQLIYVKTLEYALSVFQQSEQLSTTIVPIAPASVVLVNFHAYPSDTLYSLLYAIRRLQDTEFLEQNYPFNSEQKDQYQLATGQAADQILQTYQADLQRHWHTYFETVYDQETGLIKTGIVLSGTKDTAIRQSAFYDNVILWRTHQLAEELELIPADPEFRDQLKSRIIERFWQEDRGIFIEDLSTESTAQGRYSSDWLIVLITGFLNPLDPEETKYFEQSIDYIQRNAIDQPFGLQFHPDLRKDQQFVHLKTFAPQYGSRAIWSNWGMEYIKALGLLYQATGQRSYLETANRQLEAYTFNIKRFQGYPEVYAPDGDLYQTLVYSAVRKTGWVVSYQQARSLIEYLEELETGN